MVININKYSNGVIMSEYVRSESKRRRDDLKIGEFGKWHSEVRPLEKRYDWEPIYRDKLILGDYAVQVLLNVSENEKRNLPICDKHLNISLKQIDH